MNNLAEILEVRKTSLFAPFTYKSVHFAKTGSGQTRGKVVWKKTRFGAGGSHRRLSRGLCRPRAVRVLSFPVSLSFSACTRLEPVLANRRSFFLHFAPCLSRDMFVCVWLVCAPLLLLLAADDRSMGIFRINFYRLTLHTRARTN